MSCGWGLGMWLAVYLTCWCWCWRRFSTRVLLALSLSALADALLVWPAHFLPGMAVFGAAHLLYIAAFGFRPLRPALGLGLYTLSAWGQ